MDPHREASRRQHRVLGHFLAVQAWLRGLDCIVLVRGDLEAFLGLERFKSQRVAWLKEDLEPWFPQQQAYYKSKSPSSLSSLFLSRVALTDWLASGTMSTEARIKKVAKDGPKVERFSNAMKGRRAVRESDVVRYLAILDSGLSAPTPLSSVPTIAGGNR